MGWKCTNGVATGSAFGVLLVTAGCAGPNSVESQSPGSTVDRMSTVQAAQMTKLGGEGREIGQGGGDSMQPIYGNNTILVIEPIAFEKLKAGMNVAYKDPWGNRIVHRLLYMQGDDAWVAQGLNNPGPDKYLVTKDNLIGVVYGSFQAAQDPAAEAK